MIDTTRIGSSLHHPGGEERLDFGSEQQPITFLRGLSCPVQGTDAKAVARQDDATAAAVPESEGELPAQVRKQFFLIVLPAVRDQFRVAVGGEAMAASFQFGTHFGVVEQFAIEDDGDGAILIMNGLAAVGQPDNAETARGKRQSRPFEEAIFIRSAMIQSLRHRLDCATRRCSPLARQINDPRNTAHPIALKSEIQNPKSERNLKSKSPNLKRTSVLVSEFLFSSFRFLSDFGFRISYFPYDAYSRRTRRATRASTRRGRKRLTRKIQRASQPRTVSVQFFFNARRMPAATFSG